MTTGRGAGWDLGGLACTSGAFGVLEERPNACFCPLCRDDENMPGSEIKRGKRFMTSFGKHLAKVLLGVSMAGVVGFVPGARGQSQTSSAMAAKPDTPDPADQGWHVDVAPYIWFAGVTGTVGTAGRQSSIHVSAGDVLSNVNLGIMGAVDARYNRIVIPVDFMWVKLTDERGLPIGQGTTSLHVKLNEDIFTPKVGYRLVSKERFKVDALVGIRFWHVGNTLTLQPQLANGRYGATNWVDGVEGARFLWTLT